MKYFISKEKLLYLLTSNSIKDLTEFHHIAANVPTSLEDS
jgi:hypothetical protein